MGAGRAGERAARKSWVAHAPSSLARIYHLCKTAAWKTTTESSSRTVHCKERVTVARREKVCRSKRAAFTDSNTTSKAADTCGTPRVCLGVQASRVPFIGARTSINASQLWTFAITTARFLSTICASLQAVLDLITRLPGFSALRL